MKLSDNQHISVNEKIPVLDVSRNEQDINKVTEQIHVQKVSSFPDLPNLFRDVLTQYQNLLTDFDDKTFKKLVFQNICQIDDDPNAVFRFLNNLRIFMKSCFGMCLLVIPPYISGRIKQMLLMQSDIYIKVES